MPDFIKTRAVAGAPSLQVHDGAESSTLGEQAYRGLRSLIMQGAFAPAESIPVRVVSARLGLGATPVREALQRLAAEGVLEGAANRGVRAPELGRAELEELYETRLLLESEAAALAARRVSAVELQTIEATFEQVLQAANASNATACLAANMSFHFRIYDASRLPSLVRCIEQMWLRFGPRLLAQARGRPLTAESFFGTTRAAHERLIDAMRRHDAELARASVRELLISGIEQ